MTPDDARRNPREALEWCDETQVSQSRLVMASGDNPSFDELHKFISAYVNMSEVEIAALEELVRRLFHALWNEVHPEDRAEGEDDMVSHDALDEVPEKLR